MNGEPPRRINAVARRRTDRAVPMNEETSEIKIRDLSRGPTDEWTPPIGALGGPPAHELYRDLVLHAGLRLYRDPSGDPWVVLQDGERRRGFPVPSSELQGAMDRFRMRRNLRPVPERDVSDFARIVRARVSDPDIDLPLFGSEPLPARIFEGGLPAPARENPAPTPSWSEGTAGPVIRVPLVPLSPAVSGGLLQSPDRNEVVPRYLRALRELVHEGEWMGTADEISERVGDPPETVFDNLIEHRIQFAETGVVVAPVEVGDGWRWLAVDRQRVDRPAA